jgi:Spy/CpxP family protein refolding chaperone
MQKITLTAVSAAICSASILATTAVPGFTQQPTVAPPTKTAPMEQGITPPAKTAPMERGITPPSKADPAQRNTSPSPMAEQIKLSGEQQTKLVKLNRATSKKMNAVLTVAQKEQVKLALKQGKPPTISLTADQEVKVKEIQVSYLTQQDAILTPEQRQKVQQMRSQSTPKS